MNDLAGAAAGLLFALGPLVAAYLCRNRWWRPPEPDLDLVLTADFTELLAGFAAMADGIAAFGRSLEQAGAAVAAALASSLAGLEHRPVRRSLEQFDHERLVAGYLAKLDQTNP